MKLSKKTTNNPLESYVTEYDSLYSNKEVFSLEDSCFPDSLKFKTLANCRTMIGGGGTIPDLFVPADTSYSSPNYKIEKDRMVIKAMRIINNPDVYNHILTKDN